MESHIPRSLNEIDIIKIGLDGDTSHLGEAMSDAVQAMVTETQQVAPTQEDTHEDQALEEEMKTNTEYLSDAAFKQMKIDQIKEMGYNAKYATKEEKQAHQRKVKQEKQAQRKNKIKKHVKKRAQKKGKGKGN